MGRRTLRVSAEFIIDLFKGPGDRSFMLVDGAFPSDAHVAGIDQIPELSNIRLHVESAEWSDHYGSWAGPELDAPRVRVRLIPDDTRTLQDLLEQAWGIIANASGGNWDEQSEEWRVAASRWRDLYHGRPRGSGSTLHRLRRLLLHRGY